MNRDDPLHPLLVRQLAKSGGERLDAARLIDLVSTAYHDIDRDRARCRHANKIMAVELEQSNASLDLQNVRFRAALDNMSQGLALFDAAGACVVCNRRFLDIHGFTALDDVIGKTMPQLLESSPALGRLDPAEHRRLHDDHLRRGDGQAVELLWPDDRFVTVQRTRTGDGGHLLTLSDVTENKQAAEQIAWLARHDALTDLPNRTQLRERAQELARNARRGSQCALICLDLDRFKTVNDTLGHAVGDALLVAVAGRLKHLLRPHDLVARLGGDEFAILLSHVRSAADAERFAARAVRHLRRSFRIKGHLLRIGASAGVSFQHAGSLEAAEALRRADLALYAAKADGRGTCRLYTSAMHEEACARLKLEADLYRALEEGEFIVHYQPQLVLATNRICAFEALLRWDCPERGLVPPGDFIAICEEIGLIERLGQFVLQTAVRDAAAWPDDIRVAVNLSPVQFKSGDLVGTVRAALAESGLPACRLELEVTESLMLEDTGSVLDQIQALKRLGCRISLDDFGTGYSSLSYIRRFPFDKIKIDRSFVGDLDSADHNTDSRAIIRAVAGLCESLCLEVTAEGVETAAQLEALHRKNIGSVQGFLIGLPQDARLTAQLLETPLFGPLPLDERRRVA